MTTLYQTVNENRTLEIQETSNPAAPFQLTITVKKLGVTTSVYYFVSRDEAQAIAKTLSKQ